MPSDLRFARSMVGLALCIVVQFNGSSIADERPSSTVGAPPRNTTHSNASESGSAKSGTIAGTVTFPGEVPRYRVADDAGTRRPLLEVDRKTGGLKYAIAYLVFDPAPDQGAGATTRGRALPDVAETPHEVDQQPIVMDQREHTFVPHVMAIRSGQIVAFTNSDAANHNVRSSSLNAKNEFNIFTGAGGDYRQPLFADRNRPIRLGCDIHPWMRAWIYAFDHPHYAVTDTRGRFRLEDVPPGTHQLVVRQPDGGLSRQTVVNVDVGKTSLIQVEFKLQDLKGL